jgi:membrane protein
MASSQAIQERGRGRHAATPSDIPARGWKDILLRVWKNIGEDRVMLVAAGVSYCLLAIFPAIAALVALYGFFTDPASISSQVDKLSGVMPGGALDVIRTQMNQVASQRASKLGVAFIIGFLVSLWSANAGIKSIFDALNLVYDEPEKRGLIRLNLVSLAFTIAAIVFILVAIAGNAALPSSQLQGTTALIAQIVRWPILFVIIAVGLAFVFRYGPSRAELQWRWITWGSAFAAIAWICSLDSLLLVRRQLRQRAVQWLDSHCDPAVPQQADAFPSREVAPAVEVPVEGVEHQEPDAAS